MNSTAFTLTLCAAFFWGFSLDIAKLCTVKMNAVAFNTIQYSVLAIVITPLVLLTGINVGSTWAIAMAVAFGVSWFFIGSHIFFYCLQIAPAHVVVPIINTASIWGVIFAALLLSEGIGLAISISLAFIVIGIVLLSPRNGGERGSTSAALLSVLVAMIFGLTQVIRKSAMMSGIGALTFLWISSLTGCLLHLLTGLLSSSFRGQRLDRYNLGISASSSLLNQLVGGVLYLLALGLEKASSLAPVTSAAIPFSFLVSIQLLRERPTRKAAVGVVTIFLGVIFATL